MLCEQPFIEVPAADLERQLGGPDAAKVRAALARGLAAPPAGGTSQGAAEGDTEGATLARAPSVIEDALDDDFLDSILAPPTNEAPPLEKGEAAGPAAAAGGAAEAPPRSGSVISDLIDDDFLESLS